MAYSALTFTASEVPTLTKWNQLWANDAAMADGTGIANNAIIDRHILSGNLKTNKFSNPYKFLGKRTAAYNTVATAFTLYPYDAEDFDTNNNFSIATGQYTVPVTGFYFFHWRIGSASGSNLRCLMSLFKNTAEVSRGEDVTTVTPSSIGAGMIQCTAGDVIDVRYYITGAVAVEIGAGLQLFGGFMIAAT